MSSSFFFKLFTCLLLLFHCVLAVRLNVVPVLVLVNVVLLNLLVAAVIGVVAVAAAVAVVALVGSDAPPPQHHRFIAGAALETRHVLLVPPGPGPSTAVSPPRSQWPPAT